MEKEARKVKNSLFNKFSKLKSFFPSIWMTLLLSATIMLLLTFGALNNGVGYEGNVSLISTKFRVEGHQCAGIECICRADVSLNPFLYPISHALGKGEVSEDFSATYFPSSEQDRVYPKEIEESALASLLWEEIMTNLPYLLVIGFVSGFVLMKMIQTVKKKIVRRVKESEFKLGDAYTNN